MALAIFSSARTIDPLNLGAAMFGGLAGSFTLLLAEKKEVSAWQATRDKSLEDRG
jgi:hypothetical protein